MRHRTCLFRALLTIMIALMLDTSYATDITRDNLPLINQHNNAYDHPPSPDPKPGEYWCAPVAAASALLWLADFYHRPNLIPNGPGGSRLTTDELVEWVSRWMQTNDENGTGDMNLVLGLWGVLRESPYAWAMNVYSTFDPDVAALLPEGIAAFPHVTFTDLFEEMRAGEDYFGAAVLVIYKREYPAGTLQHATVLQQISDEKNSSQQYPGRIMDPYIGELRDVGFADIDGKTHIWVDELFKDVYLTIAIVPVVEPASGALVAIALVIFGITRSNRNKLVA